MNKRPTTVRELLSSPERWNKKWCALDADGKPTDVHGDRAVSWDLLGAISKVYAYTEQSPFNPERDVWHYEEYAIARAKLIEVIGTHKIGDWNDEHQWEDVLSAITKAGI